MYDFVFITIANFHRNQLKVYRKATEKTLLSIGSGLVVDAGWKIEKWLVPINSIHIIDSTRNKHKA